MNESPNSASSYKEYRFYTHAGQLHMHARFMPHLLTFAGTLGPNVCVSMLAAVTGSFAPSSSNTAAESLALI
jgi:hypothetical protein